ncbi:MAG: hypothetical protein WAN10_12970 [Candidatus Acidiferrales bacterium]
MKRPVSVTLVALWLFLAATIELYLLVAHPLRSYLITIFGVHLLRYAALVAYLVYIQVRVFLGIGLLDLRPAARIAGMIFCAYVALNSIVTFLMPGSLARYLAAAQRISPAVNFSDPSTMMVYRVGHVGSVAGSAGVSLLALYFLATRRAAFYAPPASGSPTSGAISSAPSIESPQ